MKKSTTKTHKSPQQNPLISLICITKTHKNSHCKNETNAQPKRKGEKLT